MTTLIAADNGRRCDAKCYDATYPGCDCICGGANHGAGFKKAVKNTARMVDTFIQADLLNHPDTEYESPFIKEEIENDGHD